MDKAIGAGRSTAGRLSWLTPEEIDAVNDFIRDNHIMIHDLATVSGLGREAISKLIHGRPVFPTSMNKFRKAMTHFGFDIDTLTWEETKATRDIKDEIERQYLERRRRISRLQKKTQTAQTICWDCKHAWALGCQKFIDGDPYYVIDGSEYIYVKHVDGEGILECVCVLSCPRFELGRAPNQEYDE